MSPAGALPEIVAEADAKTVEKAIASMQAFDAMPEEWRTFCANHGRTARGESLANLLAECHGDIAWAQQRLEWLLPIEEPPPLRRRRLKPLATYDLTAERRRKTRKAKA